MKYTILITVLFLLACSNLNNQESKSGCIIDNSVKEMNYSFSYITTTTKEGKEEGFLRVNFEVTKDTFEYEGITEITNNVKMQMGENELFYRAFEANRMILKRGSQFANIDSLEAVGESFVFYTKLVLDQTKLTRFDLNVENNIPTLTIYGGDFVSRLE